MTNAFTAVLGLILLFVFSAMFFGAGVAAAVTGLGLVVVIVIAARHNPARRGTLILVGVLGVATIATLAWVVVAPRVGREAGDALYAPPTRDEMPTQAPRGAPAAAAQPTEPPPARTALEILASDFKYNPETTDAWCHQEWEKRGVLNQEMYRYCIRTEKQAHADLVALVKKHPDLKWIDALLPIIWSEWTKRGLTQYTMVRHEVDREIEGYLDLQYERGKRGYDAAKMTTCIAEWRSHANPWTMAEHCYKKE